MVHVLGRFRLRLPDVSLHGAGARAGHGGAPLNRLSILFRIYFSRLLNPQHEVFGGPVIVATVVSFAGAVALSLSTDVVQSLLPLSERTVAFLNWRWP